MKCRTTHSPKLSPILETRSTPTPRHTTCNLHPKFPQATQANIQAHPKTAEGKNWKVNHQVFTTCKFVEILTDIYCF